MSDENISRELAQAREEISRLKRRLADERFAEELRDAVNPAAGSMQVQ